MKYRAEIDGLRAIAVLPVIFFHLGLPHFSGGYIGVDIFFVISGFLITSIILNDLENHTFSFKRFYERRARRILPALFFIVTICIPFAWALLLPSKFKDFLQSVFAVSLFISNILFWHESDYFAAESEDKPLLHTWSLAVEEQFYILFPILIICLWKTNEFKRLHILYAFAIISFILCELGWRYYPHANFYMLPTRAWELLIGSIAVKFDSIKLEKTYKNYFSTFGLTIIIFSTFFLMSILHFQVFTQSYL